VLTNIVLIGLIAALLLCAIDLGWRIVQAVTILWTSFAEDEEDEDET